MESFLSSISLYLQVVDTNKKTPNKNTKKKMTPSQMSGREEDRDTKLTLLAWKSLARTTPDGDGWL